MLESDKLKLELIEFLSKVDELRPLDREEFLFTIVKKYLLSSKDDSDIVLSYDDFNDAVSYAKSLYSQMSFPINIGNKRLESYENANYCMFTAVIFLLNKKEAFKKIPNFEKGK